MSGVCYNVSTMKKYGKHLDEYLETLVDVVCVQRESWQREVRNEVVNWISEGNKIIERRLK